MIHSVEKPVILDMQVSILYCFFNYDNFVVLI